MYFHRSRRRNGAGGGRGPGGHGGARRSRRPGGPGPRGRGGRGFGRPGGWQQADLPSADDAAAWFIGRLPSDWFVGEPEVSVDREEIIVTGELPAVEGEDGTRRPRTGPDQPVPRGQPRRADQDRRRGRGPVRPQGRLGRRIGDTEVLFSHLSVPVMTRLRQPQRQVLDTLVDAGVARSRSEALAWAVNLVGQHTDEWLSSLREAMSEVDKLRTQGPDL